MSNLAGIPLLHVRYRRAYEMKVIRCHGQVTPQGLAKTRHDFTFCFAVTRRNGFDKMPGLLHC
jgi:hypothetical protein